MKNMLSRSDKLKRRKINKFLSFIVICVTLSILILPAFTLEKKDDDTNDNNDPTTVENVNKQGGAETSNDSTLEPVINNNDDETNTIANEDTDVVLAGKEDVSITNNDDHSTVEDDVLNVEETIDDEYTVDEEPVLMAEGTTTTTTSPFVLNDDDTKIKSVKLTCSVGGVEKEFPLADGERPDNTSFKIRVEFKDVRKADLRDFYGGSFVYNLPDMGFKISKTTEREITDEHNEQIGTISFENGGKTIRIKYADDYLKDATSINTLEGNFDAEAKVDLGKLNETDGTINFAKPDNSNIELNYGPDYIERYGGVNVSKDFVRDITSDYIEYKVTVTAGEYGSKNVYVVDKLSGNKEIVESYVDIPKTSSDSLASTENGNKPYETISSSNSSAVAGKLYLANEPSDDVKVPQSVGDGTLNQPGCIVWNIDKMAPNESRVLTYYVKLKDTKNTFDTQNNQTLNNTAKLYTKKAIDGVYEYYDKGFAEKTFTPRLNKSMSKTGKYDIENNVINYTLEFGVDEGTTYPLKNVVFHDFLKHQDMHLNDDIDAFLNNFEYVQDSIIVEKKTKSDPNYQVLTRDSDYTVSFNNDPDKKFEIKGKDGNHFDMTVGDYYRITYKVKVNTNIFAEKMANELDVKNRFSVSSDNAALDSNGTMIGDFDNIQKIGGYKWVEKTVGEVLSADKNIDILSSEKVYYPDGRGYPNSKGNAFTAYKGSYKYTVVLNKTRGQWDITEADLSDNFSSDNMKYLGFMKITAYDAKTNVQQGESKWVHIDNLTSFNIQLKKFGWDKRNQYSYKIEYYAMPDGLENVAQITVNNIFKISKAVNSGGTEFNFKDPVKAYQSVTLAGDYYVSMRKLAWYYEDPKRENVGKAWENGEFYWVIQVSGKKIRKDFQIKDAVMTGESEANFIRDDSIVGIYRGEFDFSKCKNLEAFNNSNASLEEISDQFTPTLIDERNEFPNGAYPDLYIKAKNEITLGEGKNLYVVLKTEPKNLPTAYRDTNTYKNRLFKIEPGKSQEFVNMVGQELHGGGTILKELGQVFTYDGTTREIIDRGADKNSAETRIPLELLRNENGTPNKGLFISWVFKVNYAGKLQGDYRIHEKIPEGMELAYIRIKWIGPRAKDNAITTGTIDGLGDRWELKNVVANDDDGQSRTTQYYVEKSGREALIRLNNFVAGNERDAYSVDVQVVCKVTDKFYLMNGESKTFNNMVTLYDSNGIEMATANNSKVLNKGDFTTLIKDGTRVGDTKKIEYKIVANPMGQMLPTNTSDNSKLTLVDIMSKDLILLPKTITVRDADNNNVGSYTISNESTGTKLTVTIPNGMKVTINYTATVKINSGQTKNINNKVYWEGYSELANKNFDNFSYTASAGGSTSTTTKAVLTIEKYDSDKPTNIMNDVEFDVYKCTLQNDNTIVHDDTAAKKSGITTTDGTLQIELLEFNTIYEVQEPIAPDGYEDNSQKYYIMYKKIDNDTTAEVKAYVDKCVAYSNAGNNLIIAESPEEFKLEVYNKQKGIKVTKQFLNAGGNPIKPIAGTYGFGLYATPNPSAGDLAIQKVWITYNTGDDVKTDRFINLNDINGTYYVFELDQNGQPITDSNVHVVAGMEYLTTYKITKADGTESSGINPIKVGDTVTVTNQVYTRQLPATGGNGIDGCIKSGAILMLLTGVMLLRRR